MVGQLHACGSVYTKINVTAMYSANDPATETHKTHDYIINLQVHIHVYILLYYVLAAAVGTACAY